ncbi:helix-turn-helix transcriptional regulator [Leminorella grimontii]|uniref:helix-turn-helix domain-containing protein n=1 Tax=Leminorella grimontii TaxID=82981 RepID=UPI00321FA803
MNENSKQRQTFSLRLKEARIAQGLSQKGLGIAIGIDSSVASTRINRYEKGVHEADMETVQRMAEVLCVPSAYFYAADDDLAELILHYSKLPSAERKHILSLLKDRQ